jgi:hypothetical protein
MHRSFSSRNLPAFVMDMKKINSGAAWSFNRDNIDEEFATKRISAGRAARENPLNEMFSKE